MTEPQRDGSRACSSQGSVLVAPEDVDTVLSLVVALSCSWPEAWLPHRRRAARPVGEVQVAHR